MQRNPVGWFEIDVQVCGRRNSGLNFADGKHSFT
jgi:hypothetical protein